MWDEDFEVSHQTKLRSQRGWMYKKATLSLSEGNESAIHSCCSGGGLGAVPPLSDGNCESNFLANDKSGS